MLGADLCRQLCPSLGSALDDDDDDDNDDIEVPVDKSFKNLIGIYRTCSTVRDSD